MAHGLWLPPVCVWLIAFLASQSAIRPALYFAQRCQGNPHSPIGAPATQPTTTAPATIDSFQGQYRFLSNFWPAEVHFEGLVYPTAEHAYQSAKTPDRAERHRIAALPTPGDAKRAGAALPKRPDWDAKKIAVMETVVRDKFTRNPDLRAKLLATHRAQLIEGNTWNDQFWGVCDGKGENHLGRILMKVRDELRSAPTTAPAAPARSKG